MTSPTDGRVSGLNQDVFRTIQYIKRYNPNGPLQTSDAELLKKAILKDNKIDEAEADLLKELNQGNQNNITIGAQKTATFNPNDLQFTGKLSEQAKTVLSDVKPGAQPAPPPLDALWNGGPEGFKKLLNIYRSSPQDAQRVRDYLSQKVTQAWNQGSWTSGHAPLRGLIVQGYNNLSKLSEADSNLGRTLFYEVLRNVDRQGGDAIPDMLYNWIRPGGYI